MHRFNWCLLVSLLVGRLDEASSSCPCDEPRWCQPIRGPPVRPEGEVFGFYGGFVNPDKGLPIGYDMNWTHVTTVADAANDTLMCMAHQHGARAVIMAPMEPLSVLRNLTARSEWIRRALWQVQDSYRDGIVFDYEDAQPQGSEEGYAYAALVRETRDAFHAANPSLQVTTCVAWSPDNIDGRGFPYRQLASGSDLLFVMDYDTRSQIFDACIASANAPLPGMIQGMQRWFDLGVSPTKIILGVPWYGYRYPCLNGTAPDAVYCRIAHVPFRGVNCSDAAGGELNYADVIDVLTSTDAHISGGLRRDDDMDAPFFNAMLDDGTVVQYWFDDPASLRAKYSWARMHGLAGVGPWIFRALDPVGQPEATIDIWSAFDSFMCVPMQGRTASRISS